MKYELKATNFELTPSIKIYLQEKLDSLDKFLPHDSSIVAEIELAQTTRHHKKGDIFKAEANLITPGRLIRTVVETNELHAAIDLMKDELKREITGKKDKNISLYRRGARLFKKLLRKE